MSITILLEIGHEASLRSKKTLDGFTHDWEVFVRGFNGADIHYYVEKVVFHLHETFPKPIRVVSEPPYSLRTSGYAGFNLPIEIYLRNNQEPKKIKFTYDLQLQPTGPPIHRLQKEKYTFFNPSEEFEGKLLKGGAVIGSGSNFLDNSDSGKVNEKNQMTSKPKFSGTDVTTKKHKLRPEESRNTDFENLFGPPIKKTSKAPELPKPKNIPKSSSTADKVPEKVDKVEKSKTKSSHKDKEKEKPKLPENSEKRKEDKKKSKDDKNREKDKTKEKSSRKEKERDRSPIHRHKSPSPKRSRSPKRVPSPVPVQKHSSKEKEQTKDDRKEKDKERNREEKKSKKEKREHKDPKHRDKEKERDHKNREHKSSREKEYTDHKTNDVSPVAVLPVASQSSTSPHKSDRKEKERELPKQTLPPKEEEKPEKIHVDVTEERQKHKHKKKERREKREDKHSRSDDKHSKSERRVDKPAPPKEIVQKEYAVPVSSTRDIDKSDLFGSPPSDSSSPPKEMEINSENIHISSRDDESSNESVKMCGREASPVPKLLSPVPASSPETPQQVINPEPEQNKVESPKKKEKKDKKKEKKSDKDPERKRKRRGDRLSMEMESCPAKVSRLNSDDENRVSSSQDIQTDEIEPKSDYDMSMLRDLQEKIMSLKDTDDLQKIVQLIAETGHYEISAHTFDFDLCVLDSETIRRLQDFFISDP